MPTNQEWLHKLANESPDELKAWFDAEHFECPSDAGEAAIMSVDAFIAEHNDNLAAEKVVSCDDAHSNDGNAHLKSHSKTEPMLSEQSALLSEELDSREKLEADVREWVDDIGWLSDKETQVADFIAWLDRQAAITRLESLYQFEENHRYHIRSIEEVRDLWIKKANEVREENERLQGEVDTIKAANDDYRDEVNRLQRRNDELRTSYDKLKRERDNLAADLLTCNREREQLRKHLGIALDHAHDICSLVDIDGNVLDVGD